MVLTSESTMKLRAQRHHNRSKKTARAPTTRMMMSCVFVPSLPNHLTRADYRHCKLSLRRFSDSPPPSSSSSSTSSSSPLSYSPSSSSSCGSSPSTPPTTPDLASDCKSLVDSLNQAWADNHSNPYPTEPEFKGLLQPPALQSLDSTHHPVIASMTSLADSMNQAWAMNHSNPYPSTQFKRLLCRPPSTQLKRLLCGPPPPPPVHDNPTPTLTLDTTSEIAPAPAPSLADSLNQAWAVNYSDPYPGASFSELRRRSMAMDTSGKGKSKSRKDEIIEWRKERKTRWGS
ncbi:hypothetical protein L218DRAFT_491741 [Marasmius fiardii PR-910]|nr:hypothetical protein L218DRAFT_491741 [Marasmius fiardii PR-910]